MLVKLPAPRVLADGAGKTDNVLPHPVDLFVGQVRPAQNLAIETADILFAGPASRGTIHPTHSVDS